MGAVVGCESLGDLREPLVELRGGTRVERRHRTDDACLALLNDQLGVADDEQGRGDDATEAWKEVEAGA
jgi:hypothetical protein